AEHGPTAASPAIGQPLRNDSRGAPGESWTRIPALLSSGLIVSPLSELQSAPASSLRLPQSRSGVALAPSTTRGRAVLWREHRNRRSYAEPHAVLIAAGGRPGPIQSLTSAQYWCWAADGKHSGCWRGMDPGWVCGAALGGGEGIPTTQGWRHAWAAASAGSSTLTPRRCPSCGGSMVMLGSRRSSPRGRDQDLALR